MPTLIVDAILIIAYRGYSKMTSELRNKITFRVKIIRIRPEGKRNWEKTVRNICVPLGTV
jgi:hypothetical protein